MFKILLILYLHFIYLISSQEWSLVPATGSIPPPSSGYIAVKLGTTVVKYGGGIQGAGLNNITFFGRTHLFNLNTLQWTEITNPSPVGRVLAGAVSINDHQLILYGGVQYQQDPLIVTVYDEYWLFDLTTQTWTQLSFTGTRPSPRMEVGMIYDKVNKDFYIWGGEEVVPPDNLNIVGDMYKCSIDSHICSLVNQHGEVPVPRINFRMRNLDKETFIASGGFSYVQPEAKSGLFTFDIDSKRWTREEFNLYNPEEKGRFPTARESAVFEIVDNIIVIWGGDVDGPEFYNLVSDTWTWNIKKKCNCGPICKKEVWQYQDIESPLPAKRVESVSFQGEVYTFGGLRSGGFFDEEVCYSDIYKYTPCS